MDVVASVVIPTRDRWGQLRRALDGYAAQSVGPAAFEVLVCDDASTDGTPGRAREYAAGAPYPLRCLPQTGGRGAAAARNRGLRAARGATVVFSDDDCVPAPELLARHLAHAAPGVATIGRVAWHPELAPTPFRAFVGDYKFHYAQIADPQDAPFRCFYTANVAAPRADLLAVGGFDESFPAAAYEDIELGYRLHRAGARFVYEPAALVHHLHAMELGPTLRRQLENGREAARAFAKHPALAVEAGIPALRDAEVAGRFYGAALDYYFVAGLRGGLAAELGAGWPAALEELPGAAPGYAAGVERQFFAAQAYARALEGRVAELEGAQRALAGRAARLDRALRAANPLKNRLRAALARAAGRGPRAERHG